MRNELNPFVSDETNTSAIAASSVTSAMAQSRQAQEVQVAAFIAKKFPRNPAESMDRILAACNRKQLAEAAVYSFSRGGTEVNGPSIRLAEELARDWGNIDFSIVELEQKHGESQVMTYAWDLETNTRATRIFSVPHIRQTRSGSKPLTDPRDIYEMVANQGARRLRACILEVIPGDVVEAAMKQVDVTLNSSKEPLPDRINRMCDAFQNDFGVTRDDLRAFIGKNPDAFAASDVVRLGKIYRSMKDGVVGSDYFSTRMKELGEEQAAKTASIPETKPAPESAAAESKAVSLDDL